MISPSTIPDLVKFGAESDTYTIEIRPTTKCNYNCYYCVDLHNNKNPILEIDIQSVCDMIRTVKSVLHKKIRVYIYGGEPTLYPHLLELINGLSSVCEDGDLIEIQSNFSRKVEYFKPLCKQIQNKHLVRFCGSYHNTHTNITKFLQVCLFLKKHWFLNMVTFMYNRKKDVMKDFELARKLLGDEHCELSPLISSTIDQDPNRNNGTDKEIDHMFENVDCDDLRKHSFMFDDNITYETISGKHKTSRANMWKQRNYNFKGMRCSIMKDKIYIDWDGAAYKCINDLLNKQSAVFNVNATPDYTAYYSNVSCFECPHTRCFFDMEYEKFPSK